jgi:hypothetical protein
MRKKEHKCQEDLFKGTEFERKEDYDPVEKFRKIYDELDKEASIQVSIKSSNCVDTGFIKIGEFSVVALYEFICDLKRIKK